MRTLIILLAIALLHTNSAGAQSMAVVHPFRLSLAAQPSSPQYHALWGDGAPPRGVKCMIRGGVTTLLGIAFLAMAQSAYNRDPAHGSSTGILVSYLFIGEGVLMTGIGGIIYLSTKNRSRYGTLYIDGNKNHVGLAFNL
jgi:hypothetical protein